jgi:hypothetical protein
MLHQPVDEKLYRFEPCHSRALAITLALPPGRYEAQTFDPKTNAIQDLPALQSDGKATLQIPEIVEDAVVLLEQNK